MESDVITIGQIVWLALAVFSFIACILASILVWYYTGKTAHGERKDLITRIQAVGEVETKAERIHKNNLKINAKLQHK